MHVRKRPAMFPPNHCLDLALDLRIPAFIPASNLLYALSITQYSSVKALYHEALSAFSEIASLIMLGIGNCIASGISVARHQVVPSNKLMLPHLGIATGKVFRYYSNNRQSPRFWPILMSGVM